MSQNQIEIYVRSSPLGDVGIHWRNITKPEQPTEEPTILKQRVICKDDGRQATINSLINDTKPSIILARYSNKVLLEVTGIDAAEGRSQRMGRRISEVILWIGDASSQEVEAHLRQLAACALISFWNQKHTFATTIREAVNFEGLNSFKANVQKLEQLYDDADKNLADVLLASPATETDSYHLVWSSPVTISSDDQLYALAGQISQTLLPDGEQPFVVVAELKSDNNEPRVIYRGDVWAAPPTPKPAELVLPPQEKVLTDTQKKTLKLSSLLRLSAAILVLILLILITVVIIWMTTQPQIAPTSTPTLTPTPTLVPKSKQM